MYVLKHIAFHMYLINLNIHLHCFQRQEIKDEILKRKEILEKEMKEWRKETRHGKCTEIDENTNLTSTVMNNVNDRTTSFR